MSEAPCDRCGAPTTNGGACKNPAEVCPWHKTNEPPKTGRPSKFTAERARDAIYAAKQSKSKAGCARAADVGEATLHRWVEQDPTFTDGNGEEREFRSAFMRARAQGETVLIQGGLANDVDSSMARFLLASSFGYVTPTRRKVVHGGD